MRCTACGTASVDGVRYCRRCGTLVEPGALAMSGRRNPVPYAEREHGMVGSSSDADELIGSGIAKVIAGDGFLIVGVLLATAQTSIASYMWLLLLIPAFYLFGGGFADVFKAQQIRRRAKARESLEAAEAHDLPPPNVSIGDVLTRATTRKLRSGSDGRAD